MRHSIPEILPEYKEDRNPPCHEWTAFKAPTQRAQRSSHHRRHSRHCSLLPKARRVPSGLCFSAASIYSPGTALIPLVWHWSFPFCSCMHNIEVVHYFYNMPLRNVLVLPMRKLRRAKQGLYLLEGCWKPWVSSCKHVSQKVKLRHQLIQS